MTSWSKISRPLKAVLMIFGIFFIILLVLPFLCKGHMKKTEAMMAETRGMGLLDTGKYQDAIEKFTEAISLNPESPIAYYGWGLALSRTGNYEVAIEKFDKAIELNPEYARAYYNLACTQAILNQKQEAMANLDKSIKLDIKYKEMAQTNKDFDNLRNDPEFKKLISP